MNIYFQNKGNIEWVGNIPQEVPNGCNCIRRTAIIGPPVLITNKGQKPCNKTMDEKEFPVTRLMYNGEYIQADAILVKDPTDLKKYFGITSTD